MNGAQALIQTLTGCGVDTCFSNPGTSEMHFVAALDGVPELHGVLCLFEGTATGAADGYGRLRDRPAAALLHLGPGLANGLANLHNARRAHTPVLAIVGDHATYHSRLDAPLESDIESLARPVSGWFRRTAAAELAGPDAADAVAAARRAPGRVATLVLPADVSWSDGGEPAPARVTRPAAPVPDAAIDAAAAALRSGEPCLLLLGGTALRAAGLAAASQLAQGTGARLLAETFPARLERGAGLPAIDRLAYLAEFAGPQLSGARHLILAGARAPVSFFAYPGQPSSLVPGGCQVHVLAEAGRGRARGAGRAGQRRGPGGPAAAAARAAPGGAGWRPDRGDRGGRPGRAAARGGDRVRRGQHVRAVAARRHRGCPAARLADADRRGHRPGTAAGHRGRDRLPGPPGAGAGGGRQRHVHDLRAVDARPGTAGHHHGHLQQPVLRDPRHGTAPGRRGGRWPAAQDLLDLSRPDLDFTALATGMGVPASRARTTAEFATALSQALAEPGPHLIEALIPAARPLTGQHG